MSDCCLPDIRISQLPKTYTISLDDLLVIDQFAAQPDRFETRAITWGHALGIYPPEEVPPGGGDGGIIIPNPDHNIILNGTVKFLDGTELRPSITFIFDDNTGIYRPGDNTIGFTTGGTRTVVFREDNVGIGTDYPLEKLEVREGNILITMGDDMNGLFLGSSHRGIGGDPSVQSTGYYPLTFHVNGTKYYEFTTEGALGVDAGGVMDVGQQNFLLQSIGPSGPPVWKNPAEIWDLHEIIGEIDQNYIGKGELKLYELVTDVGGQQMSSGLTTADHPSAADGINPNANSFYEAGWDVQVDDTVVRTGGDQFISGDKHISKNMHGNKAKISMEEDSVLDLKRGSRQVINYGAVVYNEGGGEIELKNKSQFHFNQLDLAPSK